MPTIDDTRTAAPSAKPAPALKLNFLSHGTLESRDLAFSRRFYEEFLGLDVIQTSPISRPSSVVLTCCVGIHSGG